MATLRDERRAAPPEIYTKAPPPPTLTIGLSRFPKRILICLLGTIAVLTLFNAVVQTWNYLDIPQPENVFRIWNVDDETSIATFYSSLALLVTALALGTIALASKSQRMRYRWHWIGLALVFLFLTLDEAIQIHETTFIAMQRLLNGRGILYFTWIVPWSALTLLFVILFVPFLIHLPAFYRRMFILGGWVFVTGAVGFEMLQGVVVERWGDDNWRTALVKGIEEPLEMLGVAIFLYAVLTYLIEHLGFRYVALTRLDHRQGRVADFGG